MGTKEEARSTGTQSWLLRVLRIVWQTCVRRYVLLHTRRVAGIGLFFCFSNGTAGHACKVPECFACSTSWCIGISNGYGFDLALTRHACTRLGIFQDDGVSQTLRPKTMSARLAGSKHSCATYFCDSTNAFALVFRLVRAQRSHTLCQIAKASFQASALQRSTQS